MENGVVFGAAFDDDFEVVHIKIENKLELEKLRGSKYVQSNVGVSFKQVKESLHRNQLVLYSGTPCQIAGLCKFLGKNYSNLILIDVICHGVPSPGVFIDYLCYMERRFKANIKKVNFRAKELSIQAIEIGFDNNKKYIRYPWEDLFYRAFSGNLILRPSCYNCRHNNFRSGSDITIGDYWGVSTRFPEFDEKEGISLVITKTKKGKEMLALLSEKCQVIESEFEHDSTAKIICSSPLYLQM